MNIRGIGDKLAEQLVAKQVVKNLADIYVLTPGDLKHLMQMGEKSARNILNAIEQSKQNVCLDRMIYALGIPRVGRALTADLAAKFPSIDKFAAAGEKSFKPQDLGRRCLPRPANGEGTRQTRT